IMEKFISTSTFVEIGKDNYRTEIKSGKHTVIADEPEDLGGQDLGLHPQNLLLASLGACTAITLRMYADRKKWPVEKISIELMMDTVKSDLAQTTYIKSHIRIEGDINEEQRQRMLRIADACPIHKVLENPIVMTTNL